MLIQNNSNNFVSSITKTELYEKKAGNLKFKLKTIFRDINFENKKVLDIGGGDGILSFYAAWMGANEVICLEPEEAGSTTGINKAFNKLRIQLHDEKTTLKNLKFQDFHSDDKIFDIILLHNSINHLDENACINLKIDEISRDTYIRLFLKINKLCKHGAKIIITDCSRYNFFSFLKVTNPFMKSIEWHKHQSPKQWAELLSIAGFSNPEIEWLSFNTLRTPGKLLFGNVVTNYFVNSYFCLKMEKCRDVPI